MYAFFILTKPNQNQTFHYTRRITPKRVTSLPCPSPRHSAKTTQLPAYTVDVEAVRYNFKILRVVTPKRVTR